MLEILSYKFIINALIISVFCSLSSAIIGSWVVVKRKVLISGGITHASFGGIGLAYFLGINPVIGSAVFAIAAAVGIELSARKKLLREDSAIGLFWSLGMALGIIFIFLTPGYAPDLNGYLFGNILTVNNFDIIISAILCLILVPWFVLNYNKILFISYDEEFAEARHVNMKLISMILMLFTALTIVINIKISGIVLVISMLCIGQSAANLLTHDFKKMILYSFFFLSIFLLV
ncbi:metal ABC transporter permease, partial [Bacteroidales bacterium OttesenSCG-928-K03]|nr:metal ABC transporter permease [Bacteroidales bacterium OttesenSCG-928-K03]